MNILVLSDSFWPDQTGGITKSLLPEVEELAKKGHRVAVGTRRLRRGLPFHEKIHNYDLFRYRSPSKNTAFYRLYPFYSIRQIPNLVSLLQRNCSLDAAYVHNPFQAIGLSTCSDVVPYVYVFHAPTPLEIEIDTAKGKYGFATPLAKMFNSWVKIKERQALNKASSIIVRSKFMKKEMLQFYGGTIRKSKIVHIPLCVDTDRFSPAEDTDSIRKEIDLPTGRPILLTVRRLTARMGWENLIVAMKYVVKLIPSVLLIIGGKGYLENFLRSMIRDLDLEDNIKFLGFISEEKLQKYYQAVDLFVLPTMMLEGFGLVTIEALSCGTPVVATPVGANPEVLEPLGKEFLCQEPTPEALAERIVWFLRRGMSSELKRYCREYCYQNFNKRKIVNLIEKEICRSTQER